MRKLILLFFLFSTSTYSQEINIAQFVKEIKPRRIQIPRDESYPNTYLDLDKHICYEVTNNTESVNVDYSTKLIEGSFFNKNDKEYTLCLLLTGDLLFFGHAENYGNIYMTIAFDKNKKQIGEINFSQENTTFKEKVDINNDGLDELIFEDYYAQMGCMKTWIKIVSKNKFIFNSTMEVSCENAGFKDYEFTLVKTDYSFFNSQFILNRTLDSYVCKGRDNEGNSINTFLNRAHTRDIFEFDGSIFKHLAGESNFDEEDEKVNF